MGGEHGVGMSCGEAAAGVGGARLHQNRSALRAARHVQRSGHPVIVAAVVDRPDAVGSRVMPAEAVIDDRVLGPAVPQRLDHGHELLAPGIARGVGHLAGAAKVARRRGQPRGDDVPGDAPVADVIEGRELPREVERFGIGGRRGGDHPDAAGRRRHRRQGRDGLEPAACRLRHILAERELVGEKDGVEQRRLRSARQILVVADIGQGQRRGRQMPP